MRCYHESRREDFEPEKICTYSDDNDMVPGEVPQCLAVLNQIEKAAIKKIKPFLHMYKKRGGNVGFSGNCISFSQNVESFAKRLPWSVKDLPISIIQSNNSGERKFYESTTKIRNALICLKEHHPDYELIVIDEEALKQYLEDGGEITGISRVMYSQTNQIMIINIKHQIMVKNSIK